MIFRDVDGDAFEVELDTSPSSPPVAVVSDWRGEVIARFDAAQLKKIGAYFTQCAARLEGVVERAAAIDDTHWVLNMAELGPENVDADGREVLPCS